MKPTLPFLFGEPPTSLKTARLDNIALLPASLLPLKRTNQPLANQLPTGSVLVVPGNAGQQKIMAKVTSFFRDNGWQVISVTIEKIIQKIKNTLQPQSENLPLAFFHSHAIEESASYCGALL